MHTKLWASKSWESQLWEFWNPIWESWNKTTFGVGPVARHIIYYKGEGGAFPQVQAVVSLCLLVVRSCPKMFYAPKCSKHALTNLFFGLCKSVWMIEMLVNLPNPILELHQTHHFPLEVLRARGCAPTPSHSIVHLWTRSWVHEGVWGCVTYKHHTRY
jgi:hypothetical protein